MKSLQGRIATQHLSPKVFQHQENTSKFFKNWTHRCSQMFTCSQMLANVGKPATAVTFVGNLGLPASNTPPQLGKDGLASDFGWHRGASNGSRGSTELSCSRIALSSLVISKKWIPMAQKMAKTKMPKIQFCFRAVSFINLHPQTIN